MKFIIITMMWVNFNCNVKGTLFSSPGSKACDEVGRDCSDLLTVDFMSWFRTRGDEPIQAGSSQLLFPPCSILVGLVGALMARSYI